jgi:hypothetical protein
MGGVEVARGSIDDRWSADVKSSMTIARKTAIAVGVVGAMAATYFLAVWLVNALAISPASINL